MALDNKRLSEIREDRIDVQEQSTHEERDQFFSNTIAASGSVPSIRDDNGTILLYEDFRKIGRNEDSYDQYLSFPIGKKRYITNEVINALDQEIVEIKRNKSTQELLAEFFSGYNRLKSNIPTFGVTSSIEYIVNDRSPAAFVSSEQFSEIQDQLINSQSLFTQLQSEKEALEIDITGLQSQIDSLQAIIDTLTGN